MKDFFNYDNKFIQIMNKVADMMIISTMWTLLCLTVVCIGPASAAAYHAMAKAVRYERESAFKEFWRAFRQNFWKSLFFGVLLTLFAVSIYFVDITANVDFLLHGAAPNGWNLFLLIIKTVILAVLALYVFPIMTRFNMPVVRIFLSSLLLSARHLLSTIFMVVLLIIAAYGIMSYPYLVFLVPGAVAFVQTFPMEKIMRAHMSEEDKEEDESVDQWYLDT